MGEAELELLFKKIEWFWATSCSAFVPTRPGVRNRATVAFLSRFYTGNAVYILWGNILAEVVRCFDWASREHEHDFKNHTHVCDIAQRQLARTLDCFRHAFGSGNTSLWIRHDLQVIFGLGGASILDFWLNWCIWHPQFLHFCLTISRASTRDLGNCTGSDFMYSDTYVRPSYTFFWCRCSDWMSPTVQAMRRRW